MLPERRDAGTRRIVPNAAAAAQQLYARHDALLYAADRQSVV
jgi:hypothetical protein